MVVTMLWIQSYTVVTLSLCVVIMISIILLCCICCDQRSLNRLFDKNKDVFTIRDDIDYSRGVLVKERGFFRDVPSSCSFKATKFKLFNKDGLASRILFDGKQYSSMEDSQRAGESVFQLECIRSYDDKEDDIKSCISNDSKQSFYSTMHIARSLSAADTIRSALSHADLDKI